MTDTNMSCPKCGGVAQHAEWCRDVSTMPGDEPASRWPSDTYDAGEPYPEDAPPHDGPCDTCDGTGNAPCLACGGTGICGVDRQPLGWRGVDARRCPECDPPLPCPDCDEQLISERNHEKRCAYARLEQG